MIRTPLVAAPRNPKENMKLTRGLLLAMSLPVAVLLVAATPQPFWGNKGHTMAGTAAAEALPADMPAFFRGAAPQLAYLNPEPDRWRDRDLPEMNEAFRYDHYIDLENVPQAAREARDRYQYLAVLYRETSLDRPERDAGFLPFHIIELHQRLVVGFTRWRAAATDAERGWIEDRILNDAGTLGHYVTDASQPHHTTIHFNGWAGGTPNPNGFTNENDFHFRFETQFVEPNVTLDHIRPLIPAQASTVSDVRSAVWSYLDESNAQVEPLYALEKSDGFAADSPTAATIAFTSERLAAGATMLRDLWWSAWVASGEGGN